MFLLNFYKIIGIASLGNSSGKLVKTNGTEYNVSQTQALNGIGAVAALNTLITSYSEGAVFGDGDTPPALEDYKLSGNVITGISATVVVNSVYEANGMTTTATYTVTNNKSASVTIREIGVCTNTSSTNYVLVERTVLDTPITIEPGGVGQVTYTIRMNYPIA